MYSCQSSPCWMQVTWEQHTPKNNCSLQCQKGIIWGLCYARAPIIGARVYVARAPNYTLLTLQTAVILGVCCSHFAGRLWCCRAGLVARKQCWGTAALNSAVTRCRYLDRTTSRSASVDSWLVSVKSVTIYPDLHSVSVYRSMAVSIRLPMFNWLQFRDAKRFLKAYNTATREQQADAFRVRN